MQRITSTDLNHMACRLAGNIKYATGRKISIGWGQPYGYVYHVEVFVDGENTQQAAAAPSTTKRGCYDAMYSACVALERVETLKGNPDRQDA